MPSWVWALAWAWAWAWASALETAPEACRSSAGWSVDAQERTVSYLQGDLPPPELFPPPLKDVPVLLAASSTSLKIQLNVAKRNGQCPARVIWTYKADQDLKAFTIESPRRETDTKWCEFNNLFENLKPKSVYSLQAEPGNHNNKWYIEGDTPRLGNSYPLFARTCSSEVSPIKDLRIHSVGNKWFGLSWLPPEFDCVTQFEYRVSYSSADKATNNYQPMGVFWSDKVRQVLPGATMCVAWPQRHCLVLAIDVFTQEELRATVQVRRLLDDERSKSTTVRLSKSSFRFGPSAPVGLRADPQASALTLSWRCPLVLGGRLDAVHGELHSADGRTSRRFGHNVTLCPAYTHTISDLKENTEYTVTVWFSSTAGLHGDSDSVTISTLPRPTTKTTATSTTISSTLSMLTETSTMEGCVSSPLPHQQLLVQSRRDENQWMWIAGCSALLAMVFVAFFVGRRSATSSQWKRSRLEETQSFDGIDKKGDKAWLCAGPGAGAGAGAGTPPASVLPEYAEAGDAVEVDLSSGRAWAAVARPSVADHYEELRADKPYAEIGDQGEATNHDYAEVHKATPPPQPLRPKPLRPAPPPPAKPAPTPTPSNSGAGAPVYAEVDLEKKHAQRAKR